MNSAEKKRIVELNLRIFMMRDALVNNYITEEKTRPLKEKINLERQKPHPQNDDKRPLKPQPRTYSFMEAIMMCRGLEVKPILD